MRADVAAVLAAGGGVATIGELTAAVPVRTVRRAIARGELVRLQPQIYAAPGSRVRAAAAARSTGGAVSHRSALVAWNLAPPDPAADVHVTVERRQVLRPRHGVVIHRSHPMPRMVLRSGLPVVELDRTLVDCWATLPDGERRAAVIRAVRERRTTADRIQAVLASRPTTRGAGGLRHLLSMIAAGCHSELEIWGLQRVLVIPGLPRARHQIRVSDGRRVAYLDAGWEDVQLAVEFDGAATHAGEHREHDLRRDTWLAARGWLVLRISYRRLMDDPIGVRAEIAAAYDVRRIQRALVVVVDPQQLPAGRVGQRG